MYDEHFNSQHTTYIDGKLRYSSTINRYVWLSSRANNAIHISDTTRIIQNTLFSDIRRVSYSVVYENVVVPGSYIDDEHTRHFIFCSTCARTIICVACARPFVVLTRAASYVPAAPRVFYKRQKSPSENRIVRLCFLVWLCFFTVRPSAEHAAHPRRDIRRRQRRRRQQCAFYAQRRRSAQMFDYHTHIDYYV